MTVSDDQTQEALDVAAIGARYEKAMTLVADLCMGQERWKMAIPVDLERDSDITLTRSLNDIPRLLDDGDSLTAERDRARDAAVALEQQNAEALRVAQDALAQVFVQPSIKLLSGALYDIQRVLGAGDD